MLALIALSGCVVRPDPIPHYEKTDVDTAIEQLRARLAGLKCVRGGATLVLTDATKQTVRLDAAFAFAPPSNARLRAWKFGQAVFDLTLREDGAWAYLPRDEAKPSVPNLSRSVAAWLEPLCGGPGAFAGYRFDRGDTIEIVRPGVRLFIDRPTLTVRKCVAMDDVGDVERFTLTLADYRPAADGQVWPMTIVGTSAQGTFEVHARDVEVNADLDPATFKPPARAEKLP